MKRILLASTLLAMLVAFAGCGSKSLSGEPSQPSIVVSPASVSLIAGQTQQFTATVSGGSSTAVTWSLSGTGCTGTTCGSIDANGMYTAPSPIPASATVTVTATASGVSSPGTAKITHMPVAVAIAPETVSLISADTKQFTATVSNTPAGANTGVTWSVSGGGTISGGLYTAPAKVAVDTSVIVTATSQWDTSKSGKVTFLVKAAVVTVSPNPIAMELGAQQQFVAAVTNVPTGQTAVTWLLNGPGGLNSSGLYSSPMQVDSTTTAMIQAVSAFDESKVGKATVTLNPVVIGISPKTVTLYSGQTQQFTATVANHVSKTVTWSVTGSECAGAACGTIDTNGLYHAPSSITDDSTVTVKATSVADTRKSDSAVVTLTTVKITVAPKTASVSIGGTQQFSATVLGTPNTNATWSVSGTGCSGSACGTISSSGLYTAPSVAPTPPTVTVKANAAADDSKFDTATVTITTNPNIKLNGMYAFGFSGWDANGKALDAIGSVVADGNGHLTGLIDMNGMNYTNHTYHAIKQNITGTYQVTPNGNRGEMVLNAAETWTFRFAFDATGDRGHFLLFEPSGRYGSGMFKRQTPADFSLSKLNGDYVLGMAGMSSSGDERNAVVGRMNVDAAGAISNTSLDVVNTGEPPQNLTFGGTVAMNSGTGMSSGRGTIAVTSLAGNLNFSFFVVDSKEAFVMSTDAFGLDLPLFIGKLLKQTGGPFSAASFNGRSVFYMTGILAQTVRKAAVTAGQFDVTNGAGKAFYTWNSGGSVFSGSTSFTSAINANGRGTWSFLTSPYVLYLVAPNTGFVMDYTSPGGGVNFGFFEPQTAGPFSNATLNGEYFGGAFGAATSGVGYGNGLQTWDGNGQWNGIGNNVGPGFGLQPDLVVAGTYIITDNSIGSGNWQSTSPGIYNKRFYVISPNKIVFVPTETSNIDPALEMFEK